MKIASIKYLVLIFLALSTNELLANLKNSQFHSGLKDWKKSGNVVHDRDLKKAELKYHINNNISALRQEWTCDSGTKDCFISFDFDYKHGGSGDAKAEVRLKKGGVVKAFKIPEGGGLENNKKGIIKWPDACGATIEITFLFTNDIDDTYLKIDNVRDKCHDHETFTDNPNYPDLEIPENTPENSFENIYNGTFTSVTNYTPNECGEYIPPICYEDYMDGEILYEICPTSFQESIDIVFTQGVVETGLDFLHIYSGSHESGITGNLIASNITGNLNGHTYQGYHGQCLSLIMYSDSTGSCEDDDSLLPLLFECNSILHEVNPNPIPTATCSGEPYEITFEEDCTFDHSLDDPILPGGVSGFGVIYYTDGTTFINFPSSYTTTDLINDQGNIPGPLFYGEVNSDCCQPIPMNPINNNTCQLVDVPVGIIPMEVTNFQVNLDAPVVETTVSVHPGNMSVIEIDDGSSCGVPATHLVAADGTTVCDVLYGPPCGNNGETFDYDFSTTCQPELAGTLTCGGCPTSCPDSIHISGNIPEGTHQAAQSIISDGIVPDDCDVEFKAGDVIRLDTGFTVPANSNFSGEIENCAAGPILGYCWRCDNTNMYVENVHSLVTETWCDSIQMYTWQLGVINIGDNCP